MIAWTIATIGGTLHHVKPDDIIQALPDFGLVSYNRLTHLRRIGESLPSILRVYQLPRVGDRHLEIPRDAPIHPFVHPYQRMTPSCSSHKCNRTGFVPAFQNFGKVILKTEKRHHPSMSMLCFLQYTSVNLLPGLRSASGTKDFTRELLVLQSNSKAEKCTLYIFRLRELADILFLAFLGCLSAKTQKIASKFLHTGFTHNEKF